MSNAPLVARPCRSSAPTTRGARPQEREARCAERGTPHSAILAAGRSPGICFSPDEQSTTEVQAHLLGLQRPDRIGPWATRANDPRVEWSRLPTGDSHNKPASVLVYPVVPPRAIVARRNVLAAANVGSDDAIDCGLSYSIRKKALL